MKTQTSQPPQSQVHDVVFDCPHCNKNLVIDYRGAGLMISCPNCGEAVQVPIPEGLDITDIDLLGAVTVKDEAGIIGAGASLPLPDSPDQIRMLMTELEELRFRRRYLEQQRAETVKSLQSLARQVTVMRATLEQIEDILKNLNEPSSNDTQALA